MAGMSWELVIAAGACAHPQLAGLPGTTPGAGKTATARTADGSPRLARGPLKPA